MATVSPAVARRFSPEDVIVGLLALTENAAGGVRFPADTVRIHKGVATLRKDSRFSDLFGGLAFDARDYFPYCDSLEGILDGLQLSGYLERTNPRGTHYLSLPSLRAMFDSNIRQKFTDDELASLREASAKFFAMLRP
jgi:hypothetical protein